MVSRRAVHGVLLILPTVLVIFGFIFFPVAYSIYLSFTDSHALYPDYAYVGIENYPRLLAEPEFWSSAWNGAVWAVSTTLLQLVLGLGVALLLNESFRGRGLVRGIALFPYIVPTIVTILVWKWMLNATYGTVNYFLISLGLVRDPVVFLSPKWIMLSLIVVGIWQFFPFVVISVLARLQTIDLQLYEAAEMDGANVWQRFRHVTLPALRYVLFVVILLRTFFMFTKFDIPWLMSEGGGLGAPIQNLPVLAFRRAFGFLQAGEAAAISVTLFAMLVVFTIVYFRVFRREAEAAT
jgi:multiple sugar transport system permease protein